MNDNKERALRILNSLGLAWAEYPALARELAAELDAAEQRGRDACATYLETQAQEIRDLIAEHPGHSARIEECAETLSLAAEAIRAGRTET
jgi:hypothetical protein